MYKRILAPVDGSHASMLRLQEAVQVTKDQQAMRQLFRVESLAMKLLRALLIWVVFALGVIASGSVFAQHHHGGHVRFGVYVGPGYWYPPLYYGYPPYYYGYSPYYYPPVVAAPGAAPNYVEQGSAQPAPARPQGYWYYCSESKAYYPYVKECPSGWQQVAPQPAG
jgi:hypothetical protein